MCYNQTTKLHTHTWPRFENTLLLGISNFYIFLVYKDPSLWFFSRFWFPIKIPNNWKIPNNSVCRNQIFPIIMPLWVHTHSQTHTHINQQTRHLRILFCVRVCTCVYAFAHTYAHFSHQEFPNATNQGFLALFVKKLPFLLDKNIWWWLFQK